LGRGKTVSEGRTHSKKNSVVKKQVTTGSNGQGWQSEQKIWGPSGKEPGAEKDFLGQKKEKKKRPPTSRREKAQTAPHARGDGNAKKHLQPGHTVPIGAGPLVGSGFGGMAEGYQKKKRGAGRGRGLHGEKEVPLGGRTPKPKGKRGRNNWSGIGGHMVHKGGHPGGVKLEKWSRNKKG